MSYYRVLEKFTRRFIDIVYGDSTTIFRHYYSQGVRVSLIRANVIKKESKIIKEGRFIPYSGKIWYHDNVYIIAKNEKEALTRLQIYAMFNGLWLSPEPFIKIRPARCYSSMRDDYSIKFVK